MGLLGRNVRRQGMKFILSPDLAVAKYDRKTDTWVNFYPESKFDDYKLKLEETKQNGRFVTSFPITSGDYNKVLGDIPCNGYILVERSRMAEAADVAERRVHELGQTVLRGGKLNVWPKSWKMTGDYFVTGEYLEMMPFLKKMKAREIVELCDDWWSQFPFLRDVQEEIKKDMDDPYRKAREMKVRSHQQESIKGKCGYCGKVFRDIEAHLERCPKREEVEGREDVRRGEEAMERGIAATERWRIRRADGMEQETRKERPIATLLVTKEMYSGMSDKAQDWLKKNIKDGFLKAYFIDAEEWGGFKQELFPIDGPLPIIVSSKSSKLADMIADQLTLMGYKVRVTGIVEVPPHAEELK